MRRYGTLSIVAFVCLRLALAVMIICACLFIGGMASVGKIDVTLDGTNSSEEQIWEACLAMRSIAQTVDLPLMALAPASVLAFIFSILSFRTTSIPSSIIRTVYLLICSVANIVTSEYFSYFSAMPDTYDESYILKIIDYDKFFANECIIVTTICCLISFVFVITSIIAIIKVIRNSASSSAQGSWGY